MASNSGKNSPYSASFTGAGMVHAETNLIVPLFLEKDPAEVLSIARADMSVLQIKSSLSRDRVAKELLKRYKTMPPAFWEYYLTLGEKEQRVALMFVILKTYRLLFEIQINLVIPKYNSPDRVLTKNDILMALSEIASRDEFVDSWSEETRDRLCSQYLTMLRQGGFINPANGELQSPDVLDEDYVQYVRSGDLWFLQACLLPGYQIERIKQIAL